MVTAGAWINHVISSIGCHVPVYVTQENVTYFGSPHVKEFTKEKYEFCAFRFLVGLDVVTALDTLLI